MIGLLLLCHSCFLFFFFVLQILCIHGYRQTGQTFREKTGSLRKILKKHAQFVYIDAPNIVKSGKEDGSQSGEERGWWFSDKEGGFLASQHTSVNPGYEESLDTIATALREQGPFDGILAFSQGAALLALICGLREQGDSRFIFNFAILVAGFRSLSSGHDSCFTQKVTCPTLHVFGNTDQVIPKESSEDMLQYFVDPTIINHNGGHYVPATSAEKKVYLSFLEAQKEKKREMGESTS
ncbi:esterase OVCA2-like [Diadema antillarum]|uniref:esterase OVCA2-like n=1 Tax=Diadema antillarum TaxID=105358 RepID=UPI003A866691